MRVHLQTKDARKIQISKEKASRTGFLWLEVYHKQLMLVGPRHPCLKVAGLGDVHITIISLLVVGRE